jgi:GNAT superfamily N-acetyltransferase
LKPESWLAADRFWANDLGLDSLPPVTRTTAGVVCVPQRLHSGVQAFRHKGVVVIGVPPGKLEAVQRAVHGIAADEVFSVSWLQRVFSDDAETILGPAEVRYADEMSFRTERVADTRELLISDSSSYRALVDALSPNEAFSSGASAESFPAFGAFSNGLLCAVASYTIWQPSIAHIVVATRPERRREGFATRAVQALAAHAFRHRLILQWRALSSNPQSLAVATNLGFQPYCSTLYVRLRTQEGAHGP